MKGENIELLKESIQNDETIKSLYWKLLIIKSNQIKYNVELSLCFSSVITVLIAFLIVILNPNFTVSLSPILSLGLQTLSFGSILCLGTTLKNLFFKKAGIKESFNKISKALTESEKIIDMIYHEVELEKLITRNKIIYQQVEASNLEQLSLRTLSGKYYISYKQLQEVDKTKIKEMVELLKEKYEILDMLILKKKLSEECGSIRVKWRNVIDFISKSLISGLSMTLISILPILLFVSGANAALSIFTPFIIGSICGGVYQIRKNNTYKDAFNILNNKLGVNALSFEVKDDIEEIEIIEDKIRSLIREIVDIELILKKYDDFLKISEVDQKIKNLRTVNMNQNHIEESLDDDYSDQKDSVLVKRRKK